MSSNEVFCKDCVYRRIGKRIDPFERVKNPSPEILKARQEYEKETREIAYREKELYESGDDFYFEPVFYAWCEKWTMEENRIIVNPDSGEKKQLMVLCAKANSDIACPFFMHK